MTLTPNAKIGMAETACEMNDRLILLLDLAQSSSTKLV